MDLNQHLNPSSHVHCDNVDNQLTKHSTPDSSGLLHSTTKSQVIIVSQAVNLKCRAGPVGYPDSFSPADWLKLVF